MDNEDDQELARAAEELEHEIEELTLENSILESYYKTNSSDGLLEEEDKKKFNRARRRQAPTLTIEQRVQVANAEHELVVRETEESKRSSEKLIDTLRAVLEETDIRIAELKREAYEFKRDIVVGAENMRTGKTVAEKVLRYMEEKLRQRDSVTEKLKLKNATLKSQIQKVENQLRQKDGMGDALHYIDFHQLQIENKQYVACIDERNDELLSLKKTTGRTIQTLNTLKNSLNQHQTESEWLDREIASRTETMKRIKADLASVEAEIARERRMKKRLGQQTSDSNDMPDIDNYMAQKQMHYKLEKEINSWKRKVEICEMSAQTLRNEKKKNRKLQRMQADGMAPF